MTAGFNDGQKGEDDGMPRIKRWFPVSHDINHSGTMRELAREFGLSGWRVWLEILSIADRAGEDIDCTSQGALSRLTSAAETRMKVTTSVIEWLLKRNCIATIDQLNHVTRVANYWDFHRTPEQKPLPPDLPDLPDPPNLPKELAPSQGRKTNVFDLSSKKEEPEVEQKKTLDRRIAAVTARIYATDKRKFAKLIVWVKEAQKYNFDDGVIAQALVQFEPHAGELDNWWAYLDKVIKRLDRDAKSKEAEADSERFKRELKDIVDEAAKRGIN